MKKDVVSEVVESAIKIIAALGTVVTSIATIKEMRDATKLTKQQTDETNKDETPS